MLRILRAVLSFPSVTKLKIATLLAITLVATLFEGFGVAMLFPIMDFIEKGKNFDTLVGTSKMWFYLGKFFDLFSIPKTLVALMCIVFLLMLTRQLFNYLKATYSTWLTESLFSDIRGNGFRLFVLADLPFYDSHGVGQLINALTVDGVRAGGGVFTFFTLIGASLIFIFYLAFLFLLSPGMTLFALSIMGIVGVILKSRIRKSGQIGLDVSQHNEKIAAGIVERLNGVRFIKLAATEERETEFVKTLSENIKSNTYTLARIRARMEFVVDPMVILCGLVVLYLSVEVFHMSLAETGIFIFVLLRLMPYTRDIFNSRQGLAGFSGSLFRVTGLLSDAQAARVIEGGDLSVRRLQKNIRFENVSFYYRQDEGLVLKDLNISIPAGKMTALVGRSGAGKSTLVDLIPRLRVPVEGRIFLDGHPLEGFDLRALRKSIAFVSQEGFLFNESIEYNIRYCRPDAPLSDLHRAAEMAYADPFIQGLPEGYKTVVGERGIRLSGGQRQRVVLARALHQLSTIIILDEPTSALDSESEDYIQKAMGRIRADAAITMIVIAHRLSTIRSADQIIVLDGGHVVECGSHGALMHDDQWYASMVKLQGVA
jgi:ABC-type multidrug transport system fused ATPase/permease subunit